MFGVEFYLAFFSQQFWTSI